MEERERSEGKKKSQETKSTESPAADTESRTDRTSGESDADKLDVCSDHFDPLAALYSPTVSVPFPNVKCFNNVAAYESFLKGGRGRAKPENVEKRRLKAMRGVADPERIERLKKLMVNKAESEEGESSRAPRGRRHKPQKNVLTRMPLCKGSPLGELYRCVEERIRVKVHIRTFKGMRGVCSGFIVAFDKFWNMALVDVDETFREPLFGEALYHEKALTVFRLFEKLNLQENSGDDESAKKHRSKEGVIKPVAPVTRTVQSDTGEDQQDKNKVSLKASQKYGRVHTRHVNQLFIRGENVILVNPQPL